MAEGFLAGYPMVDIKCAVFDGSYHSVDSNEMAFKTAARIGFRAACEQAGAILLEPMATMDIVVTEEYAGAVMGNIATRRGRIVGTDCRRRGRDGHHGARAICARWSAYTKDLRAMTRGSWQRTPSALEGYEAAPARRDEEAGRGLPRHRRHRQVDKMIAASRPARRLVVCSRSASVWCMHSRLLVRSCSDGQTIAWRGFGTSACVGAGELAVALLGGLLACGGQALSQRSPPVPKRGRRRWGVKRAGPGAGTRIDMARINPAAW